MHEINREEILFYGLVWAIAFLANFCRCYRDATGVNLWNVIAGSGMAGFLAFGFVSYVADGGSGGVTGLTGLGRWRLLGLSALLGLIAKDPDKLAWMVISKALSAVKASIPDAPRQDDITPLHDEENNGKPKES